MEYWEQLASKLAKMSSYRRIIGSLVGSCLKVAAPLVSSQKELACLVALDIIEVLENFDRDYSNSVQACPC